MIPGVIKLTRRNLITCLTAVCACGNISAGKQPAGESLDDLMRRGVSAENSHRAADAADAYEKLLKRDITFEATVAPRLVDLYISMNQPASALSWAKRVAGKHPEPKAYLAGIYSRLGQHKEAELLLRQAIHEKDKPAQRVPLLWQLADAQESQGDSRSAIATLENACNATKDAGLRQTSIVRIKSLQKRLATANVQESQTGNQRQPEGRQ